VHSIFCEGGAQLASSLLGGDLVDRLTLFHAPFFLGADGSDPFRTIVSRPLDETHRWRRVRHAAFGPDTMISLDR
jgi:diaminohydroxyphosphoribosylaminopyrimidine deaminase/5-amino-6-(5-phosphoribosylamino)uracil reductase